MEDLNNLIYICLELNFSVFIYFNNYVVLILNLGEVNVDEIECIGDEVFGLVVLGECVGYSWDIVGNDLKWCVF